MSKKNDTANISLNDQLAQLDALIAWFDQDDVDLDEALQKFDQGVALVDTIKARLGKFEHKITILKTRFDQTET